MNSREQFLKTVNHQQPDRVVFDMGSTGVTGIHVRTVAILRNHFGLQNKPVRVIEPFQMLGEVDWELIDSIGIDVIGAWSRNNIFRFSNHAPFKEWKTPWGQRVMVPGNFNTTSDSKGDVLIYPGGDTSISPCAKMPKSGYSFDAIIRRDAIAEEKPDADNSLEEFGLMSETDLGHWRTEVDKAYFSGKAVIASFGGADLSDVTLFPETNPANPENAGSEVRNRNTAIQPGFVNKPTERQAEIAIENLTRFYSVAGNRVNTVFISEPCAGIQDSCCPPEQFDEIWQPYYKKLNDWIHENTQWKTFKHCCGPIEPLMESFIRAGFDIINPGQINADGMDPVKLKQKYGHDIVFWGRGIDTQKILPFATPAEVREHVLRTCEIFNKDGGFVFNSVNNIQANVPVENIVSLLDAIREFNGK